MFFRSSLPFDVYSIQYTLSPLPGSASTYRSLVWSGLESVVQGKYVPIHICTMYKYIGSICILYSGEEDVVSVSDTFSLVRICIHMYVCMNALGKSGLPSRSNCGDEDRKHLLGF